MQIVVMAYDTLFTWYLPLKVLLSDCINLQQTCVYSTGPETANKNKLLQRDKKNPRHVPWHESHAVFLSLSLSLHQSPQLSVSSSLESTSTSLGGSFLFVEKGGEISSERLLSGHSVLPLHNHRNPGGSGEGLSTPNFCRCRYTSRHKLNGQSRVCLLALILTQTDHSFRGACIWVHEGILPYLCIHKSKKPLHAHTQNVCFLHYTLPSSNLLLVHCSEEIMSIPAALVLLVLNILTLGTLVQQIPFVDSADSVTIK